MIRTRVFELESGPMALSKEPGMEPVEYEVRSMGQNELQ